MFLASFFLSLRHEKLGSVQLQLGALSSTRCFEMETVWHCGEDYFFWPSNVIDCQAFAQDSTDPRDSLSMVQRCRWSE